MPLTEERQGREAWLSRGSNRAEWSRLQSSLELADGFVFLPIVVGDRGAEIELGQLLMEFAEREGLALGELVLDEGTSVREVLERLRAAPQPALFWMHRGVGGQSLEQFFSLLNQKRDVISALANVAWVVSMDVQDWELFRSSAPDFWSVHHTVTRLGPMLSARDSALARTRWLSFLSPELGPARVIARHGIVVGWAPPVLIPRRLHGRETESAFLRARLHTPGERIVVTGLVGIGKTALLSHVLPQVREGYTWVYWMSFRAFAGDAQARVAGVRRRLLESMLPYAADMYNLDISSAELLLHATESRAVLLVLEDVDDLAALDSLRFGSRSSMVVTARRRPEDSRFAVLALGGLGSSAGAALLGERADLDAETAGRVARLAHGHPGALTVLGGILSDSLESASKMITQLEVAGVEMIPVIEAAVERMLSRCTAEAQALWPKLGLFEDVFAAADVGWFNLPESALTELVAAGLIEGNDPHRFHAMLRPLARRQLDAAADAGLARLAHAKWALRQNWGETPDHHAAVQWLGQQRTENGDLPDAVWTVCKSALDSSMVGLRQSTQLMALGWEVARTRHEPGAMARVCHWFGDVELRDLNLAAARGWFQRLAEVAGDSDQTAYRAFAYDGLGVISAWTGDLNAAIDWHQQAIDCDGTHMLGGRYLSMADAGYRGGQDERTWNWLQEAFAHSDARSRAKIMVALCLLDGDDDGATSYAHMALHRGGPVMAANMHVILAVLDEQRGDFSGATAQLIEASRLYGVHGLLGRAKRAAEVFERVVEGASVDLRPRLREAWHRAGLN